ncbi:molybdopterin dinucleotide-binding protein [Methanospirillum sp. J.3.6.1-F.2.7.3]|uniref:Molybdopterin dinucleotide-binding protein n=1 Tax=Methanospirillum purgamenti TaxID=2834276 RepID=A0A8E7B3N4_9EURY|nr:MULTISPECIES: molybdopterin dinucleotide binding domain-containing protein [Methanospirillum]MDX8551440.1 molybdopterin dinucleotide binding domain-containing protein [Methanospirillum hungatei]QVV89897.1 molybdopterin dinucleotide-binding protein [Methanospirillum sp. J.3.6.1-F.2.7.3]
MISQRTLTMITHRSIEEGIAMEKGKQSREYFDACSVIEMNDLDMLRMGIEEDSPVRVVSECGEVVVTAIIGIQELPPGMCHIRQGVWANQIVPIRTQSTGVPQYSGFPVTVTPAPELKVRSARDLICESVGMWREDAENS